MSAIRGHGGMPARGDKADLTDSEIKSAINYMFNPAGAVGRRRKPKAEPAEASDPSHKSIEGMEIFLGVLPAESCARGMAARTRRRRCTAASRAARAISSSTSRCATARTKAEIKDAQIEARVANLMNGRNPEARDRDDQQRGELRQLLPDAGQGSPTRSRCRSAKRARRRRSRSSSTSSGSA